MRLLLLLFILNVPILLISQKWQTAEWITSDGQRDTGQVKMPVFRWRSIYSIEFKKRGTRKTMIGNDITFLHLLEGAKDTLIITPFIDGEYHKLQLLVKGQPALYFDLESPIDNYFLRRHGTFEKWDFFDIKEDLTVTFDIYDPSFF